MQLSFSWRKGLDFPLILVREGWDGNFHIPFAWEQPDLGSLLAQDPTQTGLEKKTLLTESLRARPGEYSSHQVQWPFLELYFWMNGSKGAWSHLPGLLMYKSTLFFGLSKVKQCAQDHMKRDSSTESRTQGAWLSVGESLFCFIMSLPLTCLPAEEKEQHEEARTSVKTQNDSKEGPRTPSVSCSEMRWFPHTVPNTPGTTFSLKTSWSICLPNRTVKDKTHHSVYQSDLIILLFLEEFLF